LPSLYDLDAPNPRDIYEIVLAASFRADAFPQGLQFPMTDVRAAAAFLLGDITAPDARVYNLMARGRVAPEGANFMAAQDWLATVDIPPGIARVIAEFPDTLHADAAFDTDAARAVWSQMSDAAFDTISDTDALLARRRASYQRDPALT
jgi:hypothetical protein